MKFLLALIFLISIGCAKPTVTDSQGRTFERIRTSKTNANGVIDIELWQIKGKTGPGYPFYIKLMMDTPTFTQIQ